MKSLILAGAIFALTSAAASASDLPIYEPPSLVPPGVMPPGPPMWDWTGIYVGAHGGYGWARTQDDLGFRDDRIEGPIVGGQAGINWQWKSLVLGLEAQGSWTGLEADETPVLAGKDVDWLASVRARLGVGFNRILVYGTGGGAATQANVTAGAATDDPMFFGWVVGGGAEVGITPNLSVGAEFLHYEFGEESIALNGAPFNADASANVVMGRVNWKIGLNGF